jgi:hypothetical protein
MLMKVIAVRTDVADVIDPRADADTELAAGFGW